MDKGGNVKTVVVFAGEQEDLEQLASEIDSTRFAPIFEREIATIEGMVAGSSIFPVSTIVLDMREPLEPSYVTLLLNRVKGASPSVKVLALINERESWGNTNNSYPLFAHYITPNPGDYKETIDDMVRLFMRDREIGTPHRNGKQFSTRPFTAGLIGTGKLGKSVAREILTKFENVTKIFLYNRTAAKARGVLEDIKRSLYSDEKVLAEKFELVDNLRGLRNTDFNILAIKEKYESQALPMANRRQLMLRYDIESAIQVADALEGYEGVVLNFSNPLEYITKMIKVDWRRKIGISPDGHMGGRFEDLLLSHFTDVYREEMEKSFVPFEDGDLVKVKGAIVIGEHGDSMVPLFSQVQFIYRTIVQKKPVLKSLPFYETREELRERKEQISNSLKYMGEVLYIKASEPLLESGRVCAETLNQILSGGITFGVVRYWDPSKREQIYLQLPAQWKIEGDVPKIEHVYTPGDIIHLSSENERRFLTTGEWTGFIDSSNRVWELYDWGGKLEEEVRMRLNKAQQEILKP